MGAQQGRPAQDRRAGAFASARKLGIEPRAKQVHAALAGVAEIIHVARGLGAPIGFHASARRMAFEPQVRSGIERPKRQHARGREMLPDTQVRIGCAFDDHGRNGMARKRHRGGESGRPAADDQHRVGHSTPSRRRTARTNPRALCRPRRTSRFSHRASQGRTPSSERPCSGGLVPPERRCRDPT